MGDPRPRERRSAWLMPLVLAAAAVLVRSRHLDWGLPDLEEEAFPMNKAFEMCGWGTGKLQLDPHTAGWPSLSFYVHMALQHLQYGVGRLTGAFADRGDFFLLGADPTALAVWARWVSVLCAGVVVHVGAAIGRRLAGPFGGILAGLALLFSPLATRYAHHITPDVLLAMFAALALARLVDITERGRRRDYVWAGVWIGLGISAKYTPVFLLPSLYLAHRLRRRTEKARPRAWGLADRRLWSAVLACAVAFAATSPFVLADRSVLSRDVDLQVRHLAGGHFGSEGQRPGPAFYLLEVLGPGLGWPVLIVGLAGLLAAARRRGGPWLVLLAAGLTYFLALSLWQTRFDRYLLPALPVPALGLAAGWALIAGWWHGRAALPPAVRRGAVALVVALVFLAPALDAARFLRNQGRPGTLQLAKSWIMANPERRDTYLAMELYTPVLPRENQLQKRLADPALPRLSAEQRRRYLDLEPLPVLYLPFHSTSPHAADFYYDLRHYLQYDFVVTSSLVRGRYESAPAAFPRQTGFYRDLETYAPAVRVFAPDSGRRGPELRVHAITDDTRARVARDRPELTQAMIRQSATGVSASHFHDFVWTVADHALARGAAATAALYYQPLYETSPPGRRAIILPSYATALVEAERWHEARPLLEAWRAQAPDDPGPPGLLGLVAARTGRTDEARSLLKRCLALTADAPPADRRLLELAAWARKQLDALPAGAAR